jgi:hypothetical protein
MRVHYETALTVCEILGFFYRLRGMRVLLALLIAIGTFLPAQAFAQRALSNETLLEYIRARDDLPPKQRKRWEAEIKKRFGGAALKEESDTNVEVKVAKQILSAAIFMDAEPDRAVKAAWDGYHGTLGYVPPPIAIHYQILTLQGRQPRGRPIDLAFKFPDYYNEEIAPELVAYWEEALAAGKIQDDARSETIEALDATRIKMRPLLLDKLRVLARLEREIKVAKGARRAEIEQDKKELETELSKSFSKVARRPEVLDKRKRAFDRLRIQLEDMGLRPTDEDRLLDPDAPPPPRKPVPQEAEPVQPVNPEGEPLVEPDQPPPSGPLPDQARPGDPDPVLEPGSGRSIGELIDAYRRRLDFTISPWIGTPYEWGSSIRGTGTDCSGFTRSVYQEAFALDLPRVSRDQFRTGTSVSVDKLLPGDLVFFDTLDVGRISHVGVYAGDGKFVHASSSKGVMYARLDEKYFKRAYRGARRLLVYPD